MRGGFSVGPLLGSPISYIRLALRLRVPLAVAVIAIAVGDLGLQFWGSGAMHPLTALCLLGIGGCLASMKRYRPMSPWRFVVLAAVVGACAARLMEFALATGLGTGFSRVFAPIGGAAFGPEIATICGAFGMAILMRQAAGRLGPVFLAVGVITLFHGGVSGVFGVTGFMGFLRASTSVALVCGAVAMLSVYIHHPVVRAAFLGGDVGNQTRIMLTVVFAGPLMAAGAVQGFGGGIGAGEVALITVLPWSMALILLVTSARHEGSVATRRRAARDLVNERRHDVRTGALNRFGITEQVEAAWVDFKSSGAQFGMILVDIGYFRAMDATFGHDDGEDVLERVAGTLQGQLRATDALGRWGADEFLMLFKVKITADMDIVARRLRAAVADPDAPFLAGLTMMPTSIDPPFGVAVMAEGDAMPTEAILRADMGLHRAKAGGAAIPLDLDEDAPFVIAEPEGEALGEPARQGRAA